MCEVGFKENYAELYPFLEKAVLRDYDKFQNPEILLLKFSENIICELKTENDRAVIRINRPGYHNLEELENELLWITEINKKTDVHTATVYTGVDGKILHEFTSGSGLIYTYSIQAFLSGIPLRKLQGKNRMEQLKQVGRIAAKLHTMEEDNPHIPDKFRRFTWDIPDTLREGARWGYFLSVNSFAKDDRKLFEAAAEKIERRLLKYGRSSKNYGLIHADLHSENILVDGNEMSLIDFDDCGYSWYLYDLASAVSQQSEEIGEMVHAYVEGYQEIRMLSEVDRSEIETFVLLRRLVRLGWMTSHQDNGVLAREGQAYLAVTRDMAEKYIHEKEGRPE